MGTVHRLDVPSAAPPLADAVEAFLTEVDNRNTARSYGTALRALVAELGTTTAVATLDEEKTVDRVGRWFARRWGKAAQPLSAVVWFGSIRRADHTGKAASVVLCGSPSAAG